MVSLHPAEAQNPARTAKPASEDRLCGWMSKAGMDATKGLFLADLERNIETFWAAVSAHGSTGMGHSAHMQEDCYKIGAVSLGLGPSMRRGREEAPNKSYINAAEAGIVLAALHRFYSVRLPVTRWHCLICCLLSPAKVIR